MILSRLKKPSAHHKLSPSRGEMPEGPARGGTFVRVTRRLRRQHLPQQPLDSGDGGIGVEGDVGDWRRAGLVRCLWPKPHASLKPAFVEVEPQRCPRENLLCKEITTSPTAQAWTKETQRPVGPNMRGLWMQRWREYIHARVLPRSVLNPYLVRW